MFLLPLGLYRSSPRKKKFFPDKNISFPGGGMKKE
jgi:hypothetical protein